VKKMNINIETNEKKAQDKFKTLFTMRETIKKNNNVSFTKTNELALAIHPKKLNVKVAKIELETNDTKSFFLRPLDSKKLPPFRPGNYITLTQNINGGIYKRAYSISSYDKNLKEYRITVKKVFRGIVSNYLFHHVKEGDILTITGPSGNFYYDSIRDSKDVFFISGGSGITPILPMIQKLLLNKEVNTIKLLYGAKTSNDLIFKREIDELAKTYQNFQVKYILSEEKREGYLSGYITEETILEEEPFEKSFFVCGPVKMYESLNEIFKKLDIPNKYIRHEIYTNPPVLLQHISHKLTLKTTSKTMDIICYEDETLLASMEKNNISIPVSCTVGVCGLCKSKLISGEVKTENSSMREKDVLLKYIHPCVTYPLSDVTIELPF